MNWRGIFTVYWKELRDTLRDRRSLMSMIIIPTVVMPGLVLGSIAVASKAERSARRDVHAVTIIGGEDSPAIVAELKQNQNLRFLPYTEDWKEKISNKDLRAAVEVPPGFEAGLKAGAAPEVKVYNFSGEARSRYASDELHQYFDQLRQKTVASQLAARGLPATLIKPFELRKQNVAAPEKVGGAIFGGMIPYVIILLCFTGAMYPALDLTAGEKERGTMETLLCSPVSRTTLVLGKFLMVLTGSLSAVTMSVVSMTLSSIVGGLVMSGGGAKAAAQVASRGGPAFTIDPVGVLGVVALVVPLAVLFAAVVFTVSLFAKSYKEGQSYVTPLIFIVIVPAMAAMFPGVDLNAKLALVPLLNVSLAAKEMLSGVWNWPQLALIFGSTAVYAAVALSLAVRMFKRESVMFRT